MTVGTGFRTDLATRSVIESPILWVDVRGQSPSGPIGVTGKGLRLGDTLARAKYLYPGLREGKPGNLAVTFPDGTFLGIEASPQGGVDLITLQGNPG